MRRRAVLCALVLLAGVGCTRRAPGPAPAARYVVGSGYQLGGVWYYPRESFQYDAAGLASVLPARQGLTADGETSDAGAMAAAHQTLQLPAIVRVTNLETGLQALVRVNDRGPASAGRIIGLSRRAAEVLGVSGAARVRVQVEEGPSLALREQLQGGPRLTVAAAPRGAVTSETLAPPPGVGQSARGRAALTVRAATVAAEAGPSVPERLPEVAERVAASPGVLMIRAAGFGQAQYARQVAARLGAAGGRVERRGERYEVVAGPFGTVGEADMALDQALRAGVGDARISVE